MRGVHVLDPKGNLVVDIEQLRCTFDGFPLRRGLYIRSVELQDAEFHLIREAEGINIRFITEYFKSDKPSDSTKSKFPIHIGSLALQNVSFSLKNNTYPKDSLAAVLPPNSVDVNYLYFSDIQASIRDISINGDSINAYFDKLSTREKSGFTIQNLRMFAGLCSHGMSAQQAQIETASSHILFDAKLRYKGWEDLGDFIHKVKIDAQLKEGSYGNMKDAAYWAPTLAGSSTFGFFTGEITGTIDHLICKHLEARLGRSTLIKTRATLVGLPNIDSTFIAASINLYSASLEDLNELNLPPRWSIPKIPTSLLKQGPVSLDLECEGTRNEARAKLTLNAAIGSATINGQLQYITSIQDYTYELELSTGTLQLHNLIQSKWAQEVALRSAKIKGRGFNPQLAKIELQATLGELKSNSYTYEPISIVASLAEKKLSAHLSINDPNIKLDLEGALNMQTREEGFSFDLHLDQANPYHLKLGFTEDSTFYLSTKIKAEFTGTDVDNLVGLLSIEELGTEKKGEKKILDSIQLLMSGSFPNRKIEINSPYLDFDLEGGFLFKDIEPIKNRFLSDFMPTYFGFEKPDLEEIRDAAFSFHFLVHDFSSINEAIPETNIEIAPLTSFSASYSAENPFEMSLKSEHLRFQGFSCDQFELSSKKTEEFYDISINCPTLYLNDKVFLKNMATRLETNPSQFNIDFWWNDDRPADSSLNKGQIHLRGNAEKKLLVLRFVDSRMLLNNVLWTFNDNGHKILFNNGDFIVDKLSLTGDTQRVELNAETSLNAGNEINLAIEKFSLSQLNFFTENYNIRLDGSMNGSINFNQTLQKTVAQIDIDFNQLFFNDDLLGDANLHSYWDKQNERIGINFTSLNREDQENPTPLLAKGYYYPLRAKNQLNFNILFNSFQIKPIESFVSEFVSDIKGTLSGSLDISGSFSEPLIKGRVSVEEASALIKLLNVRYFLNDTITLTENAVLFQQFKIQDSLNNTALLNGRISHNLLKDFKLNLYLSSDRFLFMNTKASSDALYFGTVLASSTAEITGPIKNILLKVNAQAEKGTHITIPVNTKARFEEQKYIRFVSKKEEKLEGKKSIFEKPQESQFSIEINLVATPDAKISIPLDINQITCDVSAFGEGTLKLSVTPKNGFELFGNYVVNSGTFKLSILNILEREFLLENGGSIHWTGNPTDANMDITAIYALKANITPLLSEVSLSSDDRSRNKVDVQSVMNLKGKLMSPSLAFDLRFLHMDPMVEEAIFSSIDKNNEAQMIQQTIWLLLYKTFYSPNSNIEAAGLGMNEAINLVASSFSGLVSDMIGVNVGVDVQNDFVQIDISKNWERFYFEIGGNVRTSNEQNNLNQLIGDVLVGWKISRNWSLTGFNRSNINDFTRPHAPYSQGAGIMFKRDFDTLKEFFGGSEKKEKKKKSSSK